MALTPARRALLAGIAEHGARQQMRMGRRGGYYVMVGDREARMAMFDWLVYAGHVAIDDARRVPGGTGFSITDAGREALAVDPPTTTEVRDAIRAGGMVPGAASGIYVDKRPEGVSVRAPSPGIGTDLGGVLVHAGFVVTGQQRFTDDGWVADPEWFDRFVVTGRR